MNKEKIIIFILILIILGVIGGFFSYRKNQSTIYAQNVAALNDTINTYQNKYGKSIYEKKVFLLRENDLIKSIEKLNIEKLDLKNQLKKFGKNKTVIITKTELKLDTLRIYIDSIGQFEKINEYYHIAGAVKDSLQLNTLQFYNVQSIIFGKKSQGWFKPSLITAQITNTNPYLSIKDIQSFTTIMPKKKFHLGIQTGIGVNSNLSPGLYIGLGISYSIIDF